MKKITWFFTICCLTAVAGLSVWFNYQIQFVIEAVRQGDQTGFYRASSWIVATIALLLAFEYGRQVLNASYLNQIGAQIHQTSLLRYFSTHDTRTSQSPSEQVSALNNDIEMVKNLHYDTVISLIQGVVSFLFAFTALLSLNLLTALGILLTLLVPIVLPLLFQTVLIANQEGVATSKARYNLKATDYLENLRAIQNHSAHAEVTADTLTSYQEMNTAVYRRERTSALINVLTGLAFYSTMLVILLLGGWQVFQGRLSIGGLVTLLSIAQELTLPTSLISDALTDIQSVKTIRAQLLQPAQPDTGDQLTKLDTISIKQLACQRNEQELLKPLSYHFQQGSHYLITGPSGSGKSTLLNILTGNIQDYSGQVLLEGKDARQVSYQSLQNQMAYLSQNSRLFHDSIWNNLTGFSQNNGRAEDIISLLEIFQLTERFPDLASLQEIYHDDTKLSGGQVQRLLLIRALLENKPWLILDEALSALDEDLYDTIEHYLLQRQDLSLIHISHRPSKYFTSYNQLVIH